jgi:hypothetical protein
MRVTQAKECGVTPRTIAFDRTVGFGSNFRILLRLICVKGSQSYSSNQESDQKLTLLQTDVADSNESISADTDLAFGY